MGPWGLLQRMERPEERPRYERSLGLGAGEERPRRERRPGLGADEAPHIDVPQL